MRRFLAGVYGFGMFAAVVLGPTYIKGGADGVVQVVCYTFLGLLLFMAAFVCLCLSCLLLATACQAICFCFTGKYPKWWIVPILFFCLTLTASAAPPQLPTVEDFLGEDRATWNEVRWTEYLAAKMRRDGIKARTEVRCPDETRADIATPGMVYEVEWAENYNSAPTQAVNYYLALRGQPDYHGVRPGVILLMRGEMDKVFYLRLRAACDYWDIPVTAIDVRTEP